MDFFNLATDYTKIESHLGAVINVVSDNGQISLIVNYNPLLRTTISSPILITSGSPGFRVKLATVEGQNYMLMVNATLLEPLNDGQRAFIYCESDKPQGQLISRNYRIRSDNPQVSYNIPFQAVSNATYIGILFFDGAKIYSLRVDTFTVIEIPESAVELVSNKGRPFGYVPLNGNGLIDLEFLPPMKGCQGDKGEPGCRGPLGLRGLPGKKGPVGMPGIPGPPGCKGEQGIQGPIGLVGPIGEVGPRGFQGIQGPLGIQGAQGTQGPPGDGIGFANSLPEAISQCAGGVIEGQVIFVEDACRFYKCVGGILIPLCDFTGKTGATGLQGPPGEHGPRGHRGEDGHKGEQGIVGCPGERGHRGPQGLKGEPGEKGEPGCDGKPGEKGARGAPGAKGDDGKPGARGPAGGPKGPKGEPGPHGPRGPDGCPGKRGPGWCDIVRLPECEPISYQHTGIDSNGNQLPRITTDEILNPTTQVYLGLGGRIVLDLQNVLCSSIVFGNCAPPPPTGVSLLAEVRVKQERTDAWTDLGTIDLQLIQTLVPPIPFRYIEICDITNISQVYGLYNPPIKGFSFCNLLFEPIKPDITIENTLCTNNLNIGSTVNLPQPVIATNLAVTITEIMTSTPQSTYKIWGTVVQNYSGTYTKEFAINFPIVDSSTGLVFPPPTHPTINVTDCAIGLLTGRLCMPNGFGGCQYFPIIGCVYPTPTALFVRVYTDITVSPTVITSGEFNIIMNGEFAS
jgi:hypothetical protein